MLATELKARKEILYYERQLERLKLQMTHLPANSEEIMLCLQYIGELRRQIYYCYQQRHETMNTFSF